MPSSLTRIHARFLIALSVSLGFVSAAGAQQIQLQAHRYPERGTTKVSMQGTSRIPSAAMEARVNFREGQYRIQVSYDDMKPAVLFSGDVTSYVLWGVGRDGGVENLGELWVRPGERDDELNFSTGLRNFGLLVTAEPYYLVSRPSALVIFRSGSADKGTSTTVTLESVNPAPRVGNESLANIAYDGESPLDLLQAQKVFELAQQEQANQYANELFNEAKLALQQATVMSANRARRGAQEYARRSVAAATEAIRIAQRRIAAEQLEADIARRQAEMATLEENMRQARADADRAAEQARLANEDVDRATQQARQASQEAERATREAQQARAEVEQQRQALNRMRDERRQLEAARDRLLAEQQTLRESVATIETELSQARGELSRAESALADTRSELARAEREKDELQDSLQRALSQIADTRSTAEGYIVNLPDILFDVDRATLKPEAQVVIAKVAGILLIMDGLSMRIEGHTDSTGSEEYNLSLSERRAQSVQQFMVDNGISAERMEAVGFGESRPIEDNSTAAGRQRNRRVELIIREAG